MNTLKNIARELRDFNKYILKPITDFAKEVITMWQPSEAFLLDVCRVSEDLHVLEIGDVHAAGWYATNKEDVIKALSKLSKKMHQEK